MFQLNLTRADRRCHPFSPKGRNTSRYHQVRAAIFLWGRGSGLSAEAKRAAEVTDESIAVIIPVYNGAAYLAEAIESVLAQTLPPTEILLVDDGSTDDSVAIAGRYPQVRLVQQKNAGVSAARNRGVELTSSAWIAFIDQDDLWAPEKLQRQMETIRALPQTDLCVAGHRHMRPAGEEGKFQLLDPGPLPPTERVGRSIYGTVRFVPSAVLVRRSAYEAVRGFDGNAQPCEDWDLWLRLEQAGAKFAVCQGALLLYRHHSANGSGNGLKMYLGEKKTWERRIAPTLSPLVRPIRRLKAYSGFLAGRAIIDREFGRPHRRSMLTSLAMYPFGYWHRYKVALHMLLKPRGLGR